MLTCEHAQNLFDAYLDDELSSSMRMELNTHRLRCSGCQRQLTLLESCADVVARDNGVPAMSEDFTDRVMAALPVFAKTARAPRAQRIYRLFAPVTAAAAAILMVIMIAPPIGNNGDAHLEVATPTEQPRGDIAAAVVVATDGENGKRQLMTLANEPNQVGPVTQMSEYSAPLPQVMVDGGLTPTMRGWQRLQTDGTMLRQFGQMILDRAVGDMAGDQVVPAGGAAAESNEVVPEAKDADHLPGADEDQPL